MTLRHWKGVGAVVALIAGGCAAAPNGPTTRPAVSPAAGAGSEGPARWEATGGAKLTPDQLASRAATYALTMQVPSPGPAAEALAVTDARPAVASSHVEFESPTVQPVPRSSPSTSPPETSPSVTVVQPRPLARPIAADPRADVVRAAVTAGPLSDMPQQVPESADFAPTTAPPPDPLGVRLARRASDRPRDPAAQLDYQLYAMLNGDGAAGGDPSMPQLASANGLPADDRDVVDTVVDGVANYRAGIRADPNLTPTRQIRPLEAMGERLRTMADLSVTTLAVCSRVDGFGRYEPITPARVPLGRPKQVIVYCEVSNFQPRQTPAGLWQTQLTLQSTLYAADGSVAWSVKPKTVTDLCRSRRQDYFAYEIVVLGPNLPAGLYTLRATVTDPVANQRAEADLPVTIGG